MGIKTELPTKAGPYYWRESDGDEWTRVFEVRLSESMGLCVNAGFYYETVQQRGGQWIPIPTAEELVKLQEKAKAYDDGTEAWGVYNPAGQFVLTGDKSNCEQQVDYMNDTDIFTVHQKYTCRKVRVCKEAEKD